MNAIAAVDEEWGLGKGGKLLTHLPGDLAHFREMTLGRTIIIGRATFESMSGRLLPGRETVILSKNRDFIAGCPVLRSEGEVLDYIEGKPGDDVIVAGGEEIYRLFLPYYDKIMITKIFETFDADRRFPNLDDCGGFILSSAGDVMEENGVRYRFVEYARKK